MEFKGTAALVTGASRGLGRALAEELARGGARVVMVARDEEALLDLEGRIRRGGGEAYAIHADVGEKQAIHPIVGTAAALVGPIDLLVNNAATLGPVPLRPLLETECEDLERVLSVNLVAPFRLTKALIGSMVLRERGVVLNVTSDAAREPYPLWGPYGIAKAALEHLTRIWSMEVERSGVRLISVDPGEMDTDMHAEALPDADRSLLTPASEAARDVVSLLRTIEDRSSGTLVDLVKERAAGLLGETRSRQVTR